MAFAPAATGMQSPADALTAVWADLVCARQPAHATASHCFSTRFWQHPVYLLQQRIASFLQSFMANVCCCAWCLSAAFWQVPLCCLGGSRRCLTKRTHCRKLGCRFSLLAGCAGKLLWVLSCIGLAISIYACIQHTCFGFCCLDPALWARELAIYCCFARPNLLSAHSACVSASAYGVA